VAVLPLLRRRRQAGQDIRNRPTITPSWVKPRRQRAGARLCPRVFFRGARFMSRIVFVIAVVSTLFIGGAASANQIRNGQQVQAARKGPVAKLIELERRKNEWLREKFLNR
jgi:hypothetical protein